MENIASHASQLLVFSYCKVGDLHLSAQKLPYTTLTEWHNRFEIHTLCNEQLQLTENYYVLWIVAGNSRLWDITFACMFVQSTKIVLLLFI